MRNKTSPLNYESLEQRQLLASIHSLEINTTEVPFGLPYDNQLHMSPLSLDGKVFFGAQSDAGLELWANDGTPDGNELLDLFEGHYYTDPIYASQFQDKLLLTGHGGLWVTDGTQTGSNALTPPLELLGVSEIAVTESQEIGYFIGYEDIGEEGVFSVWTTDSTVEGTQKLSDVATLNSDNQGVFFKNQTAITGDRFLFSTIQNGVWVADAETGIVEPLLPDADSLAFLQNGEVTLFHAGQGRIYRTDGTVSGTELIIEDERPNPRVFGITEDRFYYSIQNDSFEREYWEFSFETDTASVVGATTQSRVFAQSTEVASRLYYSGSDGFGFLENGQFTHLGDMSGRPIKQDASKMFFVEEGTTNLWVTGGTLETTQLVHSFENEFDNSVRNGNFANIIDGQLYFYPESAYAGRSEFWKSDGTPEGTFQISSPTNLTFGETFYQENASVGDTKFSLLFEEVDDVRTYHIVSYSHDADTPTYLMTTEDRPTGFQVVGNQLYFSMTTDLWAINASTLTVSMVEEFSSTIRFPGVDSLSDRFIQTDGAIWQLREDGAPPEHLLDTDEVNALVSTPDGFIVQDTESLWIYNISSETIETIRNFQEGETWSDIHHLQGKFFFNLRDESWNATTSVFDPIGLTTQSLTDTEAQSFLTFDDKVFFIAGNPETGYRLWSTDGSAVGTEEVQSFDANHYGHEPAMIVVDNKLLVRSLEGLWETDGTVGGTSFVEGIDGFSSDIAEFAGRAYLNAYVPSTGLWGLFEYDPSESSLVEIQDDIGIYFSSVTFESSPSDRLYFLAKGNQTLSRDSGGWQEELYYLPSPYVVSNTLDSGPGSLREAIELANNEPGTQTISFSIPAGSKIELESRLPTVKDTLILDGTLHNDYTPGSPVIEVSGAGISSVAPALRVTADYSVISGIAWTGFQGNGLEIANAKNVVVAENFVGVDLSGNGVGNGKRGILVWNSTEVEINQNVISGNGTDGVFIGEGSSNNRLVDNRIGTDPDGLVDLGNGFSGIQIRSRHNEVIDNIISGNDWVGLAINDYHASGNLVENNLIGLNADEHSLGNSNYGLYSISGRNQILDNIIAGNAYHGLFMKRADSGEISGNRIGINSREEAVPNGWGGARIVASQNLQIDNNVISGNHGIGLFVGGSRTTAATIESNFFGTDASGSVDVGNISFGLHLHTASNSMIVGNTIAGNDAGGVFTVGGDDLNNAYFNNKIGVGSDGVSRLNNQGFAMWVGSGGNQIGSESQPNVISDAVRPINLSQSQDNEVVGNYIGTDATINADLGGRFGVLLVAGTEQNQIRANHFDNVQIAIRNPNGGEGNRYSDNSMYWNVQVGIDNGAWGHNPNDPGDEDEGPNRLLNSPRALGIVDTDDFYEVRFSYELASDNATYPVEIFVYLCSNDRVGNGPSLASTTFLGSEEEGVIFVSRDLLLGDGGTLTLLAIDAAGNTSEFGETINLPNH